MALCLEESNRPLDGESMSGPVIDVLLLSSVKMDLGP